VWRYTALLEADKFGAEVCIAKKSRNTHVCIDGRSGQEMVSKSINLSQGWASVS